MFHLKRRRGFTLVEILVVIVIIGILAGIAVPVIGNAVTRARATAVKMEVTQIDQAIEAYALQYGDYPPDMSSWTVAQRHIRKAFPRISAVDLTLLYNLCHRDSSGGIASSTPSLNPASFVFSGSAINRGEALVLFLGGLSKDATSPFTGSGGPFELLSASVRPNANDADPRNYQYNSGRENAFIDFQDDRLTLSVAQPNSPLVSVDEVAYQDAGIPDPIDPIPTYRSSRGDSPLLYFNSNTYGFAAGTSAFNGYWHPEFGGVRPYKIQAGQTVIGESFSTIASAVDAWKWAENKRFQIVEAGTDGLFGTLIWAPMSGNQTPGSTDATSPAYFVAKTGQAVQAGTVGNTFTVGYITGIQGYQESGAVQGADDNSHYDNVTNFNEQPTMFEDLDT